MTNTELRIAVIAKLADSGVDTQGRTRLMGVVTGMMP